MRFRLLLAACLTSLLSSACNASDLTVTAGNPPDDWAALMAACGEDASERLDHAAAEVRR